MSPVYHHMQAVLSSAVMSHDMCNMRTGFGVTFGMSRHMVGQHVPLYNQVSLGIEEDRPAAVMAKRPEESQGSKESTACPL